MPSIPVELIVHRQFKEGAARCKLKLTMGCSIHREQGEKKGCELRLSMLVSWAQMDATH